MTRSVAVIAHGVRSLAGRVAGWWAWRHWPCVVFLVGAAWLATVGWLRPPLSADISALHIPLGIWPSRTDPEAIVTGPRPFRFDSVGVMVLAFVGAGGLIFLRDPARFDRTCGLILIAAIGASAAAALNDPALIERMDQEYEHRKGFDYLVKVLEEVSVTAFLNERVKEAPREWEQRGDVSRSVSYLLWGNWLILWSASGFLMWARGSLRRRVVGLLLWAGMGGVLACAICHRRLVAEYYRIRAEHLETLGDAEGARGAMVNALAICPEMERLERIWLWRGRLAHEQGRSNPQRQFFLAYQLARDKASVRAIATDQDLPWIIPAITDYQTGLNRPMYLQDHPEMPRAAYLHGYFPGRVLADSPRLRGYRKTRSGEVRLAAQLLNDLWREQACRSSAVQGQLMRLWCGEMGLNRLKASVWPRNPYLRFRALSVADDSGWARAARAFPSRTECAIYHWIAQGYLGGEGPGRVEQLRPMLDRIVDRPLRADMLANLADDLFRIGRYTAARECYARSWDEYCLSENLNYRAQTGLGGD